MENVQIIGTGSYLPKLIIQNDELSNFVDTSDEWIKSRTGIEERRITKGENTSSLAAKAAKDALKNAKLNAKDIDLIIVATITPDCYFPSTACIVQEIIEAENAICFDISAACSGFIYGLNIASQFLKNGEIKNALVIGAEALSKIIDWNDRRTCVLFGDGAEAVVLGSGKNVGIMAIHTASDGKGKEVLKCKAAPLFINNEMLRKKIDENTLEDNKGYLYMEGKEVFKFASWAIEDTIKILLDKVDLSLDDIDYYIPHQANLRIINHIVKKLKIDGDKFYTNLQKYGNTSSASIPIALDEMNKKGMLTKGKKILMVGFGAGLTWGGALVKWI